MYDLHAHILGHGRIRVPIKEKISSYILNAEMYGYRALGLVDHHELLGAREGIREVIEEARRQTDLLLYYGVEIPFPLPRAFPKRFDYVLVHVGRGIDTLHAVLELKKLRKPFIIAHPCALGAFCSDAGRLLEELEGSLVALEANMRRHNSVPDSLFRQAQEKSIPLVLGSDAHAPEELFPSVPDGLCFSELAELDFL